MLIKHVLAFGIAAGLVAAPLAAQDTTAKKPGGLNKVAHDVSKTMKKAGQDTKAEVKRASSGAHRALKANGNAVKREAKETTGITTKTPDSTHKPGGLNKVARDVSHASKETGAKAKHAVKKTASAAHKEATEAGKSTKEAVKKP
jgi:hypothetical protein